MVIDRVDTWQDCDEVVGERHLAAPTTRCQVAMGSPQAQRILYLVCALSLALASEVFAQAGGIYLPEDGGPINGTAQAGSAAVARDAQTAWLNPAGMTRLDSPEVMLSVMPFFVELQFNPSSQTTTRAPTSSASMDRQPSSDART